MVEDAPVVIAGAGPAGLTAAYQLTNGGSTRWSSRPTTWSVGSAVPSSATAGASTSAVTGSSPRSTPVEEFWHEILPDGDFLLRPRMSRIFYEGKFYDYPIKATNALRNLGVGGLPLRPLLPVGPDPSAQGPVQLRGLVGGPLRLAPLPHLLQDLHREGVGGHGVARCRPTGRRSGSRISICGKAVIERRCCPGASRRRSPASSRSSSTRSSARA